MSQIPSPTRTDPAKSPAEKTHLHSRDWVQAGLGVAILALTALAFARIPLTAPHSPLISLDGHYKQFLVRLNLLLAGVFLAAFSLQPATAYAIGLLRRGWRGLYTCFALVGICAFLCVFLIHFGRWQFGGFDFNIVVEMGWRQILGQRPYVDFPATTPPGFNLGAKYALELFGVSWNANLYLSAIFGCVTFLWMYWLMTVLAMGRLASASVAFAIECAAMLSLCFWWYNNSALVLAAVFFLACLAYIKQPQSVAVQLSYISSLALLSVMKPNIAGLAIVGGVVLLLLLTENGVRLLLLTLAATAAAVLFLLLNHVPIPAMLASYISVAKGRGGVGARFGYREMSTFDKHTALAWIGLLSVPLLGLIPRILRLSREKNWHEIIYTLFFPLALLIALYGLATNGEFRDVNCTVLLAAGGVLTFSAIRNGRFLRRFYIAVLCASIAANLYYGAARIRVYLVGPDLFFQWHDNNHRIDTGFLKDMRVGGNMIELNREIKLATEQHPGPYFFGTRIDYSYAVLGLPSPTHFPAWWHPGTAFPFSEEDQILEDWQKHQFQTLVFLKPGYLGYAQKDINSYYPQKFYDIIAANYQMTGDYPDITVYRRRSP